YHVNQPFFFPPQILHCLRNASIASLIAALSGSLLSHSSQKSFVALIGLCDSNGLSNTILLGNSIASPTTRASPTSSNGKNSIVLFNESGNRFLITPLSLSFVNLSTTKLLHWLNIVLLTSAGRWLTAKIDTPYFLPSFAIRSKLY